MFRSTGSIAVVIIFVLSVFSLGSRNALPSATADASVIDHIRTAIDVGGASWTAGETSVSRLTPEEKRRLTGLAPSTPEPDREFVRFAPEPEVPTSLDWRDVDGSDWITPVTYQGICGACVSFGSVGQLEARLNLVADDPFLGRNLSEQHLFSCGGGRCNWGWNVGSAMSALVDMGVASEECFPYVSGDGKQRSCDLACFNADEHVVRILDWQWVENDVDAIKAALLTGPITTCMTVYEDFFYYTGGVYEHVWGDYIYGHCITLIGWDDADESWICKNSWGIFWGEDGFFRIRWGDSGIGNDTAVMTTGPLARLMLDKTDVTPGTNVIVGIGLYNPGEDFDAVVRAVLETPAGQEHVFVEGPITLPSGMSYTEPFHSVMTVPDLDPGVYGLYLDIIDPSTDQTVSFDMKQLVVHGD